MKLPDTYAAYERLEERYADMMDLARATADLLNHMSNDTDQGRLAFCAAMVLQHRTLQQAFTRLCVAWFLYAADPSYRSDLRNESTHELAIELKPLIEDAHLPFI